MASLLRRLHRTPGERFGGLLSDDSQWPEAWAQTNANLERSVADHVAQGGSVDVAERVKRFVYRNRELFESGLRPAFCHRDLNSGNILVSAAGPPHIPGIVDLERAASDDPLADLALTTLHLRSHDPVSAEVLIEAYGLDSTERRRLEVHVVLLALAERIRVVEDRPAGWAESAAALEDLLLRST